MGTPRLYEPPHEDLTTVVEWVARGSRFEMNACEVALFLYRHADRTPAAPQVVSRSRNHAPRSIVVSKDSRPQTRQKVEDVRGRLRPISWRINLDLPRPAARKGGITLAPIEERTHRMTDGI